MPFFVKIGVKPHHFHIFQTFSHKFWRPVRVWRHAGRKYICYIENMKNTDFAEVVCLLYCFLWTVDIVGYWVLEMISSIETHIAIQSVLGWQKGVYSRLGGDCHVIIQEVWPRWIVGNMLGECHAPYILEATFFTFWKRVCALVVVATKNYIVCLDPTLQYQSTVVDPDGTFLSFLAIFLKYIVEHFLVAKILLAKH